MSEVKSFGINNMIDCLSGYNYLYVPKNEEVVKELLIGHSVKKVNEKTLELDNGVQLEFEGNEGCCCGAGCYYIEELNDCNNVITNVEFDEENIIDDEDDYWNTSYSYKIFVYAENTRIKLLQCDGDDGNGYYGTGYHIKVKMVDKND